MPEPLVALFGNSAVVIFDEDGFPDVTSDNEPVLPDSDDA